MSQAHPYRDYRLSEINSTLVGKRIRLAGFIHAKRDHGSLLFIELRDHYGRIQCVIDQSHNDFEKLEGLRVESTVSFVGVLAQRTAETVNKTVSLGDVELKISEVTILTEANILPFPIDVEGNNPEDLRLKYRYLDLRHSSLHQRIVQRSQIIQSFREKMLEQGFVEFQTPILTASSPEGARDFLVPSRMHPGKFYALPQAPQQFKQLLMVANYDKYFQIAPCFRDEDTRADRVFEFYQIDYEMAYATVEDVWAVSEYTIGKTFKQFAHADMKVDETPFRRMTYHEAMRDYGCDKPDLRNPLKLKEVTDVFVNSQFNIFANVAKKKGGKIITIPAPKSLEKPRSWFDSLDNWAKENDMPGLGYITFTDAEAKGPIAKRLSAEEIAALKKETGMSNGDSIFFVAGDSDKAYANAAKARNKIGFELDIVDTKSYQFCWISDFPFFELTDEGKLDFAHNPFSMPQGEFDDLMRIFVQGSREEKLALKAYQYDLVCNGYEISSGGVRNHRPELLIKAFEAIGYERQYVEENFSGILNAYQYGAPPHAGAAPGIDRMIMLLTQEPNLREVIAFPINQRGQDSMMGAPSTVAEKQLRELGIMLRKPEVK